MVEERASDHHYDIIADDPSRGEIVWLCFIFLLCSFVVFSILLCSVVFCFAGINRFPPPSLVSFIAPIDDLLLHSLITGHDMMKDNEEG